MIDGFEIFSGLFLLLIGSAATIFIIFLMNRSVWYLITATITATFACVAGVLSAINRGASFSIALYGICATISVLVMIYLLIRVNLEIHKQKAEERASSK